MDNTLYNIRAKNPSVVSVEPKNIDVWRMDSIFYHCKYIENDMQLNQTPHRTYRLADVIARMSSPIGWQGIDSADYLPHSEGVPLIRIKNVSEFVLDREGLIGVQDRVYESQPAIQVDADDLIITRVGTIGNVCKVPHGISRIAMGQNLTRIKVNEDIVTSEFMLAYLATTGPQTQMERYAYGGVQPSLTNKNIRELTVVAPDLPIQRAIGNKVRKAERLRELQKQLITTVKKEVNSLFGDESSTAGKVSENSVDVQRNNFHSNWIPAEELISSMTAQAYRPEIEEALRAVRNYGDWNTLGGVTSAVSSGKTFSFSEQGIPCLSTKNVKILLAEDETSKFISEDLGAQVAASMLKPDVVLMAKSGTGSIGRAALYLGKDSPVTDQEVIRIEVTDECDAGFLTAYLCNWWGQRAIEQCIYGSTGQLHLNMRQLNQIPVPLPEMKLQRGIGDDLRRSYAFREEAKGNIAQAKQAVEDLIDGSLDEDALLEESEQIEKWLEENPSPYGG